MVEMERVEVEAEAVVLTVLNKCGQTRRSGRGLFSSSVSASMDFHGFLNTYFTISSVLRL